MTDRQEKKLKESRRISKEELRLYRAMFKRKLHSVIYGAFCRLKKEERLTQKELADRLGVDPAVVCKRLRGDTNITLNSLSDMARAMEVNIEASAELWKDAGREDVRTMTSGAQISELCRQMLLDTEASGALHLPEMEDMGFDWGRWLIGVHEPASNIVAQAESPMEHGHSPYINVFISSHHIAEGTSVLHERKHWAKTDELAPIRIVHSMSKSRDVSYG